MPVMNKWNGKNYMLTEDKGSSVVLKREDGTTFEISKSEFNFSYRKNDKNN